jgi:hypothetical protein
MPSAAENNGKRASISRAALAKVHIAKKQLALDEDDYRDVLERITGHRSSKEITPDQLMPLQREFRRLGWKGYLLRRDEVEPLKYEDLGHRKGRPTPAQLRMLEARFVNIKGFADVNPDAAFRAFLEKRFGISHAKLLDDRTYEAALTAVKRLERDKGVKKEWRK